MLRERGLVLLERFSTTPTFFRIALPPHQKVIETFVKKRQRFGQPLTWSAIP